MKPDICPSCNRTHCINVIKKTVILNVRNEDIKVSIKFYQCKFCNIKFDDADTKDDLYKAYTIYRHRYNMLQPEKFTKWRKSLGLSIEEMSCLINWTSSKLGLYEHGLLQTEEEDIYLKKIMTPSYCIDIISNSTILTANKKRIIIAMLSKYLH